MHRCTQNEPSTAGKRNKINPQEKETTKATQKQD